MEKLNVSNIIVERLNKEVKDLKTPFSASQCGFEDDDKENFYCSRRRLFSYYYPDLLEKNGEFKNVMLKGFLIELAILFILRDALKNKNVKIYSNPEWKVNLGVDVVVHPDIWIPSLGEIHEIKTTFKIPEKPYLHHQIQVGIQKLACPKKNNKAYIHYFELTGREYKEKVFEINDLDKKVIDKIIEENLRIKNFLEKQNIPPLNQKFQPNKFPCSWFSNKKFVLCPFFEKCHGDFSFVMQQTIIELKNFSEETIKELKELLEKEQKLKSELKKISFEKEHILATLPKDSGSYQVGKYIIRKTPRKVVVEEINPK